MAQPIRHIAALDGIRGVAIVWVVLHNTMAGASSAAGGLSYLLAVFSHSGWIGVQLFFALSGFLITLGLLHNQRAPHYFRDFYVKRALRILPLYYTVVILLLLVLPRVFTLHAPFRTAGQLSLWLFITNWTQAAPYGFGHFWSLAVEEQFYLFWPLVVWRLAPRRLFMVCAGIAAGALLLRCAMLAAGADAWTIYTNTACRMDALALGGAGACVFCRPAWRARALSRLGRSGGGALLLFALGVPLTRAYGINNLAGQTLGYTLLAVCSAIFVTVAALAGTRPRPGVAAALAWAPLRSCGKYSYAMYVFHNLIHKLWGEPWLMGHFGAQPPVQVALLYGLVVLLVSYVLGWGSYHGLEKHFLTLKRSFAPLSVSDHR